MSAPANSSANLDLLRAVAVITVMIDHLVPTLVYRGFAVPGTLAAFTEHIGHAGVLAFFVHTSFVLMFSLERMAARPAPRLTARFYLRRLFRIYPLAIACVVAVVVLGLPAATWHPSSPPSIEVIVANLLLIQNLVSGHSVLIPLWSLPYEVEMYVVLPALYFVARRVDGARWIAGLLALSIVGGYAVAALAGGHLNIFAYVPCFLAGVLCFTLRGRLPRELPGFAWTIFVLLLIGAYCLVHWGAPHAIYWVGWLYCVILALGFRGFADLRHPLVNRVTQRIATYSYGLYLLHVPVLHVVFGVLRVRSLATGLVAYAALSTVAAVLAYHLIEAPMMSLGRRLSEPAA